MDHDKSQRADVRDGRMVAVKATKVEEDFMIPAWIWMAISRRIRVTLEKKSLQLGFRTRTLIASLSGGINTSLYTYIQMLNW
jgi:hypothetical protein